MDKVEIRFVIKYLHMKSKTSSQIFHEMKDAYEDNGPMCPVFLLFSTGKENSNFAALASETRCDQVDLLC